MAFLQLFLCHYVYIHFSICHLEIFLPVISSTFSSYILMNVSCHLLKTNSIASIFLSMSSPYMVFFFVIYSTFAPTFEDFLNGTILRRNIFFLDTRYLVVRLVFPGLATRLRAKRLLQFFTWNLGTKVFLPDGKRLNGSGDWWGRVRVQVQNLGF